MNKKTAIKLYSLWIIILIIELGWLNSLIHQPHGRSDLIFIIMVIISTIAAGVVGLNLISKGKD